MLLFCVWCKSLCLAFGRSIGVVRWFINLARMTIFNKGFSLWLVKFLGLMCEGNFALGNVKANAGKGGLIML